MHHNRGVLLNIQGNKDEGIKELQAALRIDTNSVPTCNMFGILFKEWNLAFKRADR